MLKNICLNASRKYYFQLTLDIANSSQFSTNKCMVQVYIIEQMFAYIDKKNYAKYC